jgi:hypothetical protein
MVEERSTGAPSRNLGESRPVVHSGRTTRAEEESPDGQGHVRSLVRHGSRWTESQDRVTRGRHTSGAQPSSVVEAVSRGEVKISAVGSLIPLCILLLMHGVRRPAHVNKEPARGVGQKGTRKARTSLSRGRQQE